MGKQRVEQCRAKGHLRIVRFYSKVILGPSFCSVFWTPVYSFTPAPNSGTVRKIQLETIRGVLTSDGLLRPTAAPPWAKPGVVCMGIHAGRRVSGANDRFQTVPDPLASLDSADGRMSSLVQADAPWAARRFADSSGVSVTSTRGVSDL